MASAIIHLAIAKELEKKLGIKNTYDYYLGSIAPDLAKQIGKSKVESHFLMNTYENDVPNIKMFYNKYPRFRDTAYDLGYFVHLYTDKLWFEDFITNITSETCLRLKDGTVIETTKEEMQQLIYSDYTNLNIKLIEEYDLDLSLFYEEFRIPKTNITEIPPEKLDILINKMGILIENSQEEKTYTMDLYQIKEFIRKTVRTIEKELII